MTMLTDLGPLAQLRAGRLGRRIPQLLVGLVLYGISLAWMVRAALGLAPWDVLHIGIAKYVPLTLGQVIIVTSFVVLLGWIPLREVPGLGTVLNSILIGLAADATLAVLAEPESWWARAALLGAGVVGNGVATAMYIGAQLGRGPRDGLMTGLARRTGWSLRLVRTGLEVAVVVLGLALIGLGGIGTMVGLGTIAYALCIGPLAQWMLPWFLVEVDQRRVATIAEASEATITSTAT